MAFLYVLYIVIYAIISPVIGGWLDKLPASQKNDYFKYIGGVMFTILGVIIFAATLTPRGAFKLNPEILDEYGHGDESEDEDEVDVGKKMKQKEMTEMIAG